MNPLEEWIHSVISQKLTEDLKFQSYMGVDRLRKIKKSDIENYKLFKLSEIVNYVYKRSPFYKKLFRKKGIKAGRIESFSDFSKIPFTEPRHIIENPRTFLCVPQSEILRGFTAGGTVNPMRVFYTRDELNHIVDSIAAALRTVGMRKHDVLQIMFPPEVEWGCAYLVEKAAEKCGGSARVTGHVVLDEQIQKIKEFNSSMVIGSNPYIYMITRLADESHSLEALGIKTIILSRGCDYRPFTESMRKEIQDAWGCKAYDQYGTIETGLAVSMECPAQNGLHINEADFFVETIDPNTGEILESKEEGELVFTTLNRRCVPLVRYRSRDISRLIDETCKCGATIQRMEGIKKKLEMM